MAGGTLADRVVSTPKQKRDGASVEAPPCAQLCCFRLMLRAGVSIMFNKFLVPINPDDRDIASGIVAHATWLAGRLASEVVFLSVIPFDRTKEGPQTAEIFERAKCDVERRLESLVESTESPGVRLETVVEFGSPAETIVETCRRLACDIIAMSTHGGGLFAKALAGSVTTDVIASAPVPVLVINPTIAVDSLSDAIDISTIHVALDGTLEAEAVLPHVEYLAAKLGFNVVLMRAVDEIAKNPSTPARATRVLPDENGVLYRRERQGPESNGTASAASASAESSAAYLARLTEELRRKGLSAKWVLLEGDAKKCFLGAFEESSHNMIALTNSGRSGLRRRITGSVSEGLIKKTGYPVLVVPTRVAATVGA